MALTNEQEQIAQDLTKEMQKRPEEVQYAISVTIPNFGNGCYWGFTTMEEAMEYIDLIKSNKNITARKIGDTCLIETSPQYLLQQLSGLGEGVVKVVNINKMKDSAAEARINFERFLIRMVKKGGFENKIAIYCTNDTDAIKIDGVTYPAYRMTVADAFPILEHYRYMVKVNGQWVTPQQAVKSGQALYDSMEFADSGTGIFIQIKATATPEQGKTMEQMFKKKYNITQQ